MIPPRAYYLLVNGKPHGPFPAEKLRQQFTNGILRPGTQVSADGFTWRPMEIMLAEIGVPNEPEKIAAAPSPPPSSVPASSALPPPVPERRFLQPELPRRPVASNSAAIALVWILGVASVLAIALAVIFMTHHLRHGSPDVGEGDFGQGESVPNPAPQPAAPPPDVPVLVPVKPPAQVKPLDTVALVAKCGPSVAMVSFANGHGSGFLVDANLLATNAHVVGNRDNANVRVFFPDAADAEKGPHNGRVVYLNKDRDLALVRVKSDLPVLKLGDSSVLRKGEVIVVIGSPGLGPGGGVLKNAVHTGIYSTMADLRGEGDFLQMSLAVNPGNSGGPAFNDRGEVVGVVTAKGKFVEQVALCVPVNDLKFAIESAK